MTPEEVRALLADQQVPDKAVIKLHVGELRAAFPTAELDRLRAVELAARLVSQWHGAIGSGPIEVLDAELGDLAALTVGDRAAEPRESWFEAGTRISNEADAAKDARAVHAANAILNRPLPCQHIDPLTGGSCGMGPDSPYHGSIGSHYYEARDRRNRDRRAEDDADPRRHPNRRGDRAAEAKP